MSLFKKKISENTAELRLKKFYELAEMYHIENHPQGGPFQNAQNKTNCLACCVLADMGYKVLQVEQAICLFVGKELPATSEEEMPVFAWGITGRGGATPEERLRILEAARESVVNNRGIVL